MKKIPQDKVITLPALGTWPATKHIFEEESINAVTTAYYAGRPLLIRGETGSGKSQLARAVSHVWQRLFVSEVVNSRTESGDLHYHFDAVARLADAQAANAFVKNEADAKEFLNPLKYLSPSALWWVFDWTSAEKVYAVKGYKRKHVSKPVFKDEQGNEREWQPEEGAVILIDEIDKAETDLPNDLLETLGNGAFPVPWQDHDKPVKMQDQNPPLVIITTNDERELPAAFVRRCVVLNLNPPKEAEQFKKWLCQRGEVHFKDDCSVETREIASDLLIDSRENAEKKGVPPAGQAEYLDLLRALCQHTQNEANIKARDEKHKQLIKKINQYVYNKYPEMVD